MNSLLFWMMLVWLFYVAYTLGARRTAARTAAVTPKIPPEISSDTLASMESKLAPWMDITGRKAVGGMVQFEGSLRGQAEDIFKKLREAAGLKKPNGQRPHTNPHKFGVIPDYSRRSNFLNSEANLAKRPLQSLGIINLTGPSPSTGTAFSSGHPTPLLGQGPFISPGGILHAS
jgi:hypothetical protein